MKRFLLLAAMVLVGITAEAQLVRSATLTVTREELPPVELGWKHFVDGQIGLWDYDFGLGIHYIAGYRFSENLLAGAGIGIDHSLSGFADYYDSTYNYQSPETAVPLYLHGRYYFSAKAWSPYVGASVGAYLAKKTKQNEAMYEFTEDGSQGAYIGSQEVGTKPSSSLFADFNVGLNHRLNATQDLSFYAGVKLWGKPHIEYGVDDSGAICLYYGMSFSF